MDLELIAKSITMQQLLISCQNLENAKLLSFKKYSVFQEQLQSSCTKTEWLGFWASVIFSVKWKIKERHVHKSAFVLCFLYLISYSRGVSKNGNEKIGAESYRLFYLFPDGSDSKASSCKAGRRFDLWVGKIP